MMCFDAIGWLQVVDYIKLVVDHEVQNTKWVYVIYTVPKGVFFWDHSGIGILEIDGICVLLGAILFSEWT